MELEIRSNAVHAQSKIEHLIADIEEYAEYQKSKNNYSLFCDENKLEDFSIEAFEIIPEAREDLFEMFDHHEMCEIIVSLCSTKGMKSLSDIAFDTKCKFIKIITDSFRVSINRIYERAVLEAIHHERSVLKTNFFLEERFY